MPAQMGEPAHVPVVPPQSAVATQASACPARAPIYSSPAMIAIIAVARFAFTAIRQQIRR
jgi:hypothetical protein